MPLGSGCTKKRKGKSLGVNEIVVEKVAFSSFFPKIIVRAPSSFLYYKCIDVLAVERKEERESLRVSLKN